MILNFYLRKRTPVTMMRVSEVENLVKVRVLLKKRGVPNTVHQLDYHEANQLLAKLIAGEVLK